MIGKRVVVGFNLATAAGELLEKRRRHGVIVEATEDDGIVIREPGGTEFQLPPALDALEPAAPGMYRLRETGEEVLNPDYLVVWRVAARGTPDEEWSPLTGRGRTRDPDPAV